MGVQVDVQEAYTFDEVKDSIFAGTVQGMNQGGELLLGKSQEQVPMDIGTLAETGTVVQAKTIEEPVQVVYDTAYAARLHEHPEYNFSTDENPGAKGKYLEDPAVENVDEIGNVIRAAAERGEIGA